VATFGPQPKLYIGYWTCSCLDCVKDEWKAIVRWANEHIQQALDLDGER
jgi:hypothetical protein